MNISLDVRFMIDFWNCSQSSKNQMLNISTSRGYTFYFKFRVLGQREIYSTKLIWKKFQLELVAVLYKPL